MKDHISICICTYHRNAMLERLLRKLAAQETRGLFAFSAVVVDNDGSGPARATVKRLGGELPLEITYGIEHIRTIPAARNHALRLARGNYIAIIDDDEFPPLHWLVTMYNAIQTFDVEGALGPVHPFFARKPPAWLIKGKLCERPFRKTGTLLRWEETRTGNVLLKKEVFDKHNLSFDLKWETSGSDRAFFKEAMALGCRFVAVEEAPVYEEVPPERWTKIYYLKRALVHGYNSHRNTDSSTSLTTRLLTPLRSSCAVFGYAILMPFLALFGTHIAMKYLEKGAHHLSRLAAMMGIEIVKKRDF